MSCGVIVAYRSVNGCINDVSIADDDLVGGDGRAVWSVDGSGLDGGVVVADGGLDGWC